MKSNFWLTINIINDIIKHTTNKIYWRDFFEKTKYFFKNL